MIIITNNNKLLIIYIKIWYKTLNKINKLTEIKFKMNKKLWFKLKPKESNQRKMIIIFNKKINFFKMNKFIVKIINLKLKIIFKISNLLFLYFLGKNKKWI